MRFDPSVRLIKLGLQLRSSRSGMSISNIMSEYQVSRSTVERMLTTLRHLFTGLEERSLEDGTKLWKMAPCRFDSLVDISTDELNELNAGIRALEAANHMQGAETLKTLLLKLWTVLSPKSQIRIDPDLELLMESEGFASHPGPRPITDPKTISTIRMAILMSVAIEFDYLSRSQNKKIKAWCNPLGIIFGARNYLVGELETPGDYRLFSLPNMNNIHLTDRTFVRDEEFSLKTYASGSFGVFQGPSYDVVLEFSPDAADDVKSYHFHSTQEIEEAEDGSVIVRFSASGELEICWHLFRWGNSVKIIKPSSLKRLYTSQLCSILQIYNN